MSSLTTQFNLKTDNSGLAGTIINSPLRLGDRFFVEILMENSDINPVGITSSAINLSFDPRSIQNIDNPFNPLDINSTLVTSSFPVGRTGILDNTNGSITNLGGGSFTLAGIGSPLGINQLDTFSLLHFQVIGNGNSSLVLNIDLSQTGFSDGSVASYSGNQSQFIKIVQVGSSTAIPEPSTILAMVILGLGVLLSKKRNQDNSNNS
ncbi:MAG: PEP-CTERM sorting domain-containing protein [Microcystis sp. LE18-22.4A]|uniref:PEP-CTERM sorting domain-containing protein n=1 Tax=Microcystis sp. LE18-22.4A TaxID=3016432 RepID=UPI0022C9B611|nr:PEP-CTERM sorting domain-containing protein [Microcystis sp. LE18-22.4A]MCZ8119008.1 PEP-CTERM sorting domain-containing protein [Microcystis sp. LE18-22.4A]